MRKISLLAGLTAAAAGLLFGTSAGSGADQPIVISLLSVNEGGSLIDVDRSGGGAPAPAVCLAREAWHTAVAGRENYMECIPRGRAPVKRAAKPEPIRPSPSRTTGQSGKPVNGRVAPATRARVATGCATAEGRARP